jgi:hypothetical protein
VGWGKPQKSIVVTAFVRRDDIDIDALISSYAPCAIAQRGMNVPCNPALGIGPKIQKNSNKAIK